MGQKRVPIFNNWDCLPFQVFFIEQQDIYLSPFLIYYLISRSLKFCINAQLASCIHQSSEDEKS